MAARELVVSIDRFRVDTLTETLTPSFEGVSLDLGLDLLLPMAPTRRQGCEVRGAPATPLPATTVKSWTRPGRRAPTRTLYKARPRPGGCVAWAPHLVALYLLSTIRAKSQVQFTTFATRGTKTINSL